MAKMDYSKVERMIEKAFVESTVKKLLKLAELMESFGMPDAVDLSDPVPHLEAVTGILAQIHKILTLLRKKNMEAYKKLNIDKDWMRRVTDNPAVIGNEDWEKIKDIRIKTMRYLKEIELEMKEEQTDEKLIEKEKKSHVNKRFNVRDKWWPV